MDLVIGQVVRSKAGRDKGNFLVVVGIESERIAVADGKRRSLKSPKKKNRRHLSHTNTVLAEDLFRDDATLRKSLLCFNSPTDEAKEQRIG